ncbi:MAG: hypothetical protein LBB14_03685 [Puniceicoccales bacterium]|nr:hypothetical protein [Puniceicoccales bacterium]
MSSSDQSISPSRQYYIFPDATRNALAASPLNVKVTETAYTFSVGTGTQTVERCRSFSLAFKLGEILSPDQISQITKAILENSEATLWEKFLALCFPRYAIARGLNKISTENKRKSSTELQNHIPEKRRKMTVVGEFPQLRERDASLGAPAAWQGQGARQDIAYACASVAAAVARREGDDSNIIKECPHEIAALKDAIETLAKEENLDVTKNFTNFTETISAMQKLPRPVKEQLANWLSEKISTGIGAIGSARKRIDPQVRQLLNFEYIYNILAVSQKMDTSHRATDAIRRLPN